MTADLVIQRAAAQPHASIAALIANLADGGGYDMFGAAAAYVSVAGMRLLLEALAGTGALSRSQWLLGLDDCLTHPDALVLASELRGAEVRLAGERLGRRRFHPKVYALRTDRVVKRSALVVGSANLTRGGLESNVEAACAYRARNRAEAIQQREQWDRLWQLGTPLNARDFDAYVIDFETALRRRPDDAQEHGGPILVRDSATVDPGRARVCWIEVGNITGFQSEQLEIKAEQALFFGLPPEGGPSRTIALRIRGGTIVDVPTRYYGNAMWRFNLPQSIPEVRAGLRPGGRRSPYVAVFERQNADAVQLTFLVLTSERYARIRKRSRRAGAIGSTAAREYGWY